MIKRLLELKAALNYAATPTIAGEENLNYVKCDHYLCDSQWKMLRATEFSLRYFYENMTFLEGEKHVTASWVLVLIKDAHKRLQEVSRDGHDDDGQNPLEVQNSCQHLLADFQTRWCANRKNGSGNFNIWNKEVVRGLHNRQ